MAKSVTLRAVYQRGTATGETVTLLRFADIQQASHARNKLAKAFACHKPHIGAASVVVKSPLNERLVELLSSFAVADPALEDALFA
ncbi:MAG: hypothetical protein J0L97_07810 [Alphaproteobacteria bacterium]|nr:hypothetical protein [Alphaproteobacteria bacterium]